MNGTISKLVPMMNSQPMGLLGVAHWYYVNLADELLAAVSSSASIDTTLEAYFVPASTRAIFTGSGTGLSIQELEQRIITEWLPTSCYEYANAPDNETLFVAL